MPSKPHDPHSLLTVFRKVSVLMVFRLLSAIRPQIPYLLSKPNLLIAFFFSLMSLLDVGQWYHVEYLNCRLLCAQTANLKGPESNSSFIFALSLTLPKADFRLHVKLGERVSGNQFPQFSSFSASGLDFFEIIYIVKPLDCGGRDSPQTVSS